MLRAVNWGDLSSSRLPVGALLALTLAAFLFEWALGGCLLLWVVIITVCEATRMLSSNVENLSARRYNSFIVISRSRDKDWKNGVVDPKLLLKFYNTASILYTSICWTACPNLRVKSRMDSSSHLRMDWRELMFLFCLTEHKY